MNDKIKDLLKEIDRKITPFNQTVYRSCEKAGVETFMEWLVEQFPNVADKLNGIVEFSQIADGLNFNGLFVYSLNPDNEHNIYDSNDDWHDSEELKKYLFFADDDVSWYCADMAENRYWVLDKPSGEQIESFGTFVELIGTALATSLQ